MPISHKNRQSDSDSNSSNRDGDDTVGELVYRGEALASQSSNSENGDHTYNPYSFKRLQDAIFKKSELLKDSKKPVSNKQSTES